MYTLVPLFATLSVFVPGPLFNFAAVPGQNQKFLALGIGLCIVVAGLWTFFAMRTRREHAVATKVRSNIIRERLQQVIDTDGRLEMFPAQRNSNANGQMLVGRCIACTHDSLELEFSLTPEVPEWKHEVVDVYFRSTVDEIQVFYVFTATIRATRTQGKLLRIEMPLPVHLRKEQKRALFRIGLPSNMVPALALWMLDAERDAQAELLPRSLGVPLLTGRMGKQRQLTLSDISGGGICLEVDRERVAALKLDCKVGDTYILLSVFADKTGEAEPRQFWFKCLCRHVMTKAPNGNLLIGLQFRAWCITPQVSDPIVWVPLSSNGDVPPLLDMLVNWSRSGCRTAPAGTVSK